MDTITKSVVVHPLPEAKFNTANVCDGSTVTFSDVSTITSPDIIQLWGWQFGDGSPVSQDTSPAHIFPAGKFLPV